MLTILVVSTVFLVARSNLAWRRTRDAEGSKWILGMYVVFSALFALLQSATFLIYKFNGDDSNFGLNLLGLVLIGLWFKILMAPPTGGSWNPDSFAATVDAEVKARRGGVDDPMGSSLPSQARAALPSGTTARSAARDRRGGFAKRVLA